MSYYPQGVEPPNRIFSGSSSMVKSEHNMMRKGFVDGKSCDGSNYPINVLEYNNSSNKDRGLHPTQKPVSLFEYLIKTYTNENDLILDNTAGSGTTAIAAINTNRRYILMEKEPEYYEIILKRIEEHTE